MLADAEYAEVEPPRSVVPPWVLGWSGGSAPRRLPKLAPRRPAAEQLSLFDA